MNERLYTPTIVCNDSDSPPKSFSESHVFKWIKNGALHAFCTRCQDGCCMIPVTENPTETVFEIAKTTEEVERSVYCSKIDESNMGMELSRIIGFVRGQVRDGKDIIVDILAGKWEEK